MVKRRPCRKRRHATIRPSGSTRRIHVDFRLVAARIATSKTIAAGLFRRDLHHRLNVASLSMSPLRERPADISLLVRFILQLKPH